MTRTNNVINFSAMQTFQPKKEVVNKEPKKGIATTTKVLVGTGLAALAAVGIYLATKGKVKNLKPQNLSDEVAPVVDKTKINELKTQAKELKNKIREDYLKKLHENSKGFDFKRSPVDRNAYKLLERDQQQMQKMLSDNQPIVDDFSKKVRSTVKELQKDSDYKELQRLRHKYKAEMFGKPGSPKTGGNFEHAAKLELIDEVLYTKLNNGQKTPYFSQLGISVEDAIRMIKDKSLTNSDISNMTIGKLGKKALNSLSIQKKASLGGSIFTLENSFIDGSQVKYAYNDFKRAKKILDGKIVQANKQGIRDIRVKVAKEIRQTDDVKKLKELNAQITNLEKI